MMLEVAIASDEKWLSGMNHQVSSQYRTGEGYNALSFCDIHQESLGI